MLGLSAIVLPVFDPVAVQLGPVAIRWYALAYLAGFILGWQYCRHLAQSLALSGFSGPHGPKPEDYDDFLSWAVIGVVLGGRIGYVLFYNLDHYMTNPIDALRVWHGGMSFHGGLIGVVVALILFTRQRKLDFFAFTDLAAACTPIGICLGRIANFINGELIGRVTTAEWGMIFPNSDGNPRHPSQLYQAALEGFLLFTILAILARRSWVRARPGFLSGAFIGGYGFLRFFTEFFRMPDVQLGYFFDYFSMGQLLCLPMVLIGLGIMIYAHHHPISATPLEPVHADAADTEA